MQLLIRCHRWLWAILLTLLLLPSFPCAAEPLPVGLVAEAIAPQGPRAPAEIEAFLDQFFNSHLRSLHVPGAAVAIVKDGQPLVLKGYGYADLEKKTPVDPAQTLFGVGSVSKVLTATAVMQLVEQGRLDLDEDVNTYLSEFKLPPSSLPPVTVAALLTHTGGFDDQFIGTAARTPADILPLKTFVAQRLPARVRPPNQLISYSNYGMVLAGYLVEQVSGVPFAEYMQRQIFAPLGMEHSSFAQPLPSDWAPFQAVGYQYHDPTHQPKPFYFRGVRNPPHPEPIAAGVYQRVPPYYGNDIPSGVLTTTAADMARFMIAQLEQGRYGDRQILQPATVQAMHQPHFTNDPRLPGWCYGFNQRFENGLHAVEKGGEKPGYTTLMLLLPEQHVGLFVTYNASRKELRETLVNEFLDHYYSAPQAAVQPALETEPPPQLPASQFSGTYRYIRYPHRTIEKVELLLQFPEPTPTLRVKASKTGALTLDSAPLTPIAPLLFQLDPGRNVAFRINSQRQITHLLIGTEAFEKLAWYEMTPLHLAGLVGSVLVFVAACLYRLGRLIWGRGDRRHSPSLGPIRRLHQATELTAALNLIFLIGFALILGLTNLYEFAFQIPPILVALLGIPVLAAGLTGVLFGWTVWLWRDKRWRLSSRLYQGLLMLALVSFAGLLSYWNLLGFRF